MKKLRTLFISLIFIIIFTIPALADTGINVYINSQLQSFSTQPIIQNDSTFVPMRELFSAMGYNIEWDNETKTVTGVEGSNVIQITIDSPTAYKNGEEIELAAPAVIQNDRTLVPLRFVAESTGAAVLWDAYTKTIDIITPEITIDEYQAQLESVYTIEDTEVMINTDLLQGSGTVISPDGHIVTNYHVLKDATKFMVIFNDKTYYYDNITLVYLDRARDIAVIKIDASDLHYAVLGDSDIVKAGDHVTAIGSPLGELNSVSEGVVKEVTYNYFSTSADIEHGSSGGGLFNDNGQLIGITHSYDTLGNHFSIPINFIKDIDYSNSIPLSELSNSELLAPTGLSVYYDNKGAYVSWAQDVTADYYCVFVSTEKDGEYMPSKNPRTRSNHWIWGFPYTFGISVPPNAGSLYYKVASYHDGQLSPLSEALEVKSN